MTNYHCPSCPCFQPPSACRLLPDPAFIPDPDTHWCYRGRELMQHIAIIEAARVSFKPKEEEPSNTNTTLP